MILTAGSYRLSSLEVKEDAELVIDNTDGPVTLYIEGDLQVSDQGDIVPGRGTTRNN